MELSIESTPRRGRVALVELFVFFLIAVEARNVGCCDVQQRLDTELMDRSGGGVVLSSTQYR